MVMDAHHHFAAHLHRRLRHEVERAADRPLRGIFHRHDAEIRGARLHGAKHLVDRRGRHRFGGEPERLGRGALAECAPRPEVRHRDRALEREAGRHDLAKEERHHFGREWPGIAFLDAAQDLRFALGTVSLAYLEGADRAGELGAFVDRLQQPVVDAIDRLAQPLQLGVAHAALPSSGTLRMERTPGMRAMRVMTSGAAALSRSTSVYAISPFVLLTML